MNFSLPASNRHMASPRCEIALPAWSRHRRVIQMKRSSPSMPHTAANSFTAPRSRPGPPATRPAQTSAGDPLNVRWHPAGTRPAGRLPDGTQRITSGSPADSQRTPSGPSSGLARLTPRHPKVLSGSPDDVDEAAGLPVR